MLISLDKLNHLWYCCVVMRKTKAKQAVEALEEADRLMRKAMLLLPKHRRFVNAIVELQLQLDDVSTIAEMKYTVAKK